MCGILGQLIFHKHIVPPIIQPPSLDLLNHRGPDGQGEWATDDRSVYLGHTRLAILEPTPAGAQPMHSADGRYVITFNGELYNHLSLRRLLPGIQWRGTSDTETLVELIRTMGVSALPLIKGMFAFGIYDKVDKTLLVARGRFGIKPLWLWHNEQVFRFSSEIRPLLLDSSKELNKQALSEYIAFGRMPGVSPTIGGIYSLPPGSWMKISQAGVIETGKYWPDATSFTATLPANAPRAVYVDQVRSLFTQAVEEHLLSDVGVGSFLSGGIDSSIVTLIAGRFLGKQLKTFCVGFPNADHDERIIAREVARKAGSEHYEVEVNEDTCLNWVMDAVNAMDIPSVDAINTYIVSKAVKESGIKVALSGLGGDELFGGYPSFKNVPSLMALRYLPPFIRSMAISWLPENYREKLDGLNTINPVDITVARRRFVSAVKLQELGLFSGSPRVDLVTANLDLMGQISWGEIEGYMIPMILRDSDQMSMAVGLEVRVPFLDHELVEAVLSMPQHVKRGKETKSLLVDAFKQDLPTVVYDRPKQGFALPMDSWIRGPLDEFTEEGIKLATEMLRLDLPSKNWKAFQSHKLHWTRVWSWCILGHWASRYSLHIQP